MAVLGSTALLAAWLAVWARRRASDTARGLRLGLACALVALLSGEVFIAWRGGWLTWMVLLPLQLCDLAVLLAVLALVTLNRRIVELLYFWALTGTLLAMVLPDLAWGFPSLDFFVFFGLHGLVVVAVVVLVFGLRIVPAAGAWLRAFGLTLAYAALVACVNAVLDTNFLYLRRKPEAATLLDYMGPWPAYIGSGAVLGLVLFRVLDLPLRRLRAAA
jgi:hypothetical integral membrane protein (TIGR02206 family)